MTAPLVSVIIPCYNAGRWIVDTLESALAQTHAPLEIVVVDDGSTDESLTLARRFLPRGIQVVSQPNRGASAARNHGLLFARGDYLQFLDADDLLAPSKIAAQVAALQRAGNASLASGAWGRFTDSPANTSFTPTANWRDLSGVEFLQLHYEQILMMHPAAWLAPRSLLERAGPWDESLSLNDDGEYFARVALAADRLVFCPGARSYYRSALAGSLSRRRDRRALESYFRSVELTTGHLAAADSSPRTRAALAYAWKWLAFEVYPDAPDLSRAALQRSRKLGGSPRPFPAGRAFQCLSRIFGWRLARRLTRRH